MYHHDILDSIQDLKANWQALSGVEKIQRARDILSERESQPQSAESGVSNEPKRILNRFNASNDYGIKTDTDNKALNAENLARLEIIKSIPIGDYSTAPQVPDGKYSKTSYKAQRNERNANTKNQINASILSAQKRYLIKGLHLDNELMEELTEVISEFLTPRERSLVGLFNGRVRYDENDNGKLYYQMSLEEKNKVFNYVQQKLESLPYIKKYRSKLKLINREFDDKKEFTPTHIANFAGEINLVIESKEAGKGFFQTKGGAVFQSNNAIEIPKDKGKQFLKLQDTTKTLFSKPQQNDTVVNRIISLKEKGNLNDFDLIKAWQYFKLLEAQESIGYIRYKGQTSKYAWMDKSMYESKRQEITEFETTVKRELENRKLFEIADDSYEFSFIHNLDSIYDTSNIIGWFDNTDDGMILDEVSTQSLKALFQAETNGMAKIALARKILQIRNDNEINMSFEEMAEKLADKYGFKKDDMDDAKRSYGYKDSYSLSFREDEVTTRFFKIGSSNDGKLLYFETSGVFSNYHLIYPKQESFSSYQEADNYIAQVLKDFGVINAQHISSNMESNSQTPRNADGGNDKTIFNDRDTTGQGVGITGENTSEEWNREQGNTGLPTDSTAIDGTQSDSSVVSGNGQYGTDTRDFDSTGSDQLSEDGIQADRATNPTVEADARQAERLDLATKTRLQLEAENLDAVFNDEASIRATLPFLLHEQQTDIVKIEKRLANAEGMMITNGTGTGKTYTALGAVKRFAKMGKNSILIVTPRDKIIQDFIDSGKNLHLDIKQLDSIRDNGDNGIAVTTYANFQQNESLLKRNWDLVIFDESHYLNSAQDGKATEAQNMMRALTGHKRGLYERAVRLAMLETGVNIVAVREKIKKHEAKDAPIEDKLSPEELAKLRQDELIFLEKVTPLYDEIKANPPQKSKVIFLSATPFAYDKSIDYAEGFLFDYPDVDGSGYNSGGGYERFMMQHFGYTMKYNRLTSPDVEVNSGAMQRQFNQMLQDKGALSGRALKVEADFSRQFIVLKDRIGEQLDEAFAALRDSGMHELSGFIQRTTFDYLAQQRLLEAIKAKAVIPRIKKHLALGRKVVLFHSYVTETEIRHPFYLDKNHKEWKTIGNDDIKQKLESQLIAFKAKYPKYANMKLDNLAGPIETLKKAFGSDLMVYNGKVPPKLILKNAQEFNDDNKSKDIILMQVDKGKEGVSLHDTTGKKTRVLINLGLPTKPTDSIQIEGRIYRTGQVSNAIFEYISTGTQFEKRAFSETIAKRSSTAENLALGNQARDLLSAFTEGYLNATDEDPHEEQGTGGKQYNEVAELSPYDKAISDYFATQKANKHTKAKGVDYFPTPEPIGLKMVDLAQISAGESALEPSAGHGAIARYFPDYAKSTFIEPSSELTGDLALRTAGNGDIKSMTFEQLNTINKFDAIVMNPPFGKGGSMAIDHLTKAVEHLRDAGRIVALIPNGGMADKRFDKFISEIATPYNVFLRSEIILPSVAFERAGTSVSSRIVVLDRIDDEEQAISVYPTHHDLSGNDDIKDLFNEIKDLIPRDRPKPLTEEIRQARRAAKLQAKAVEKAKKLIDGLDKLKDGVLPALRNKFNFLSNRELLIYSVLNEVKLPKIADDKDAFSARRAGGITGIANRMGLKPISDTGSLETIAGKIKNDYVLTDEQLAMILEILKRA